METQDSWLGQWLGKRSLISWIFGSFFKNSSNTSGLLAVILVGVTAYLFITTGDAPTSLQNFVPLVLGFYFGGVAKGKSQENED